MFEPDAGKKPIVCKILLRITVKYINKLKLYILINGWISIMYNIGIILVVASRSSIGGTLMRLEV